MAIIFNKETKKYFLRSKFLQKVKERLELERCPRSISW